MKFEELKSKLMQKKLCNHCFGRQFKQLFPHSKEEEIAIAVKQSKTIEEAKEFLESKKRIESMQDFSECELCNGLFEKTDEFKKKLIKKSKEVEFNNFLIGNVLPDEVLENQDKLWAEVGCEYCEPIKREINRLFGEFFAKQTGKKTEFKNPEVVFIINYKKGEVETQINDLYIYGRYNKLKRGLPQTKWPCRLCKGTGKYKGEVCPNCGGTGKQFQETVEELIAPKAVEATKASGESFHGCVSSSSNVSIPGGYFLPITNFKEERSLISKGLGLIESESIDYAAFNPKKVGLKTYEIITSDTGKHLIASESHPIFTVSGKKQVSELNKEDKVIMLPVKNYTFDKINNKLLVDEKLIMQTASNYFEKPSIEYHIKKLKERGLLPLKQDNEKLMIITRLLSFLFGDGTAHYTRGRDVALSFYGKPIDLKVIKGDIEKLGFTAPYQRTRKTKSVIKDYYGNRKEIRGTKGTELICHSKALWLLLVSLGAPVGDKVKSKMNIPKWIFKAPKHIKREFLASLFGAEMSKPRLDKRKHNKKSFNTPSFSINKIEALKENGLEFINGIIKLCKEFNVRALEPRVIPYTTRKDGRKSLKLRLDFSNSYKNLINLYGNIGFRYCNEREIESYYVYQYLKTKEKKVNKKKQLIKKALRMQQKSRLSPAEISEKIGKEIIPYKELWQYLSGNRKVENTKIKNSFPDYPEWKKQHTKGLEKPLVWETIKSIRKVACDKLVDITVDSPSHSFFANGFMVSNSGREDRDALMLGSGRPFVLELKEPRVRTIDYKKLEQEINDYCEGKVKVNSLRESSKEEVIELKKALHDKLYEAVVKTEKLYKDLKRLDEFFVDKDLKQRTPTRVAHRRKDKIRKRKVYYVKTTPIDETHFKAIVKAQAGTYIKELISGDFTRTKPSFAEVLGVPCSCEQLNVLEVIDINKKENKEEELK